MSNSNTIFKSENLTKLYRETSALKNVSITLEKGRIYGLIGQNGAGKTTLMRIISGLASPTAGSYELFGQTKEKGIRQARRRTGCMIEYPSLIGSMSAKENIAFHRVLKGMPNKSREQELLDMLGIGGTGKKKSKDFSLGMKQRLGIADALIGSPEFLILDEPINGLDPMGVVEVRNLLTDLCRNQGITILISSHNLPELYQVATDYIIMHKGEVIRTLTAEELDEECRQYIIIRCTDEGKLANVIETKLNTSNYKVMPDKSVQLYDYLDDMDFVAKTLHENGIVVLGLSLNGDSLENYFTNLIGGIQQ
ncbi:MAG: ABC transporter ATP-binding protein [Acutalibacteraceae bacterium]